MDHFFINLDIDQPNDQLTDLHLPELPVEDKIKMTLSDIAFV